MPALSGAQATCTFGGRCLFQWPDRVELIRPGAPLPELTLPATLPKGLAPSEGYSPPAQRLAELQRVGDRWVGLWRFRSASVLPALLVVYDEKGTLLWSHHAADFEAVGPPPG